MPPRLDEKVQQHLDGGAIVIWSPNHVLCECNSHLVCSTRLGSALRRLAETPLRLHYVRLAATVSPPCDSGLAAVGLAARRTQWAAGVACAPPANVCLSTRQQLDSQSVSRPAEGDDERAQTCECVARQELRNELMNSSPPLGATFLLCLPELRLWQQHGNFPLPFHSVSIYRECFRALERFLLPAPTPAPARLASCPCLRHKHASKPSIDNAAKIKQQASLSSSGRSESSLASRS